MNQLIVCGGTGAHVARALVRLQLIGYPLGYFCHRTDGSPLKFPDVTLVDQDSGNGINSPTAWEEVRGLLGRHLDRPDWKHAFGRDNKLRLESVSPLPVGARREWFNAPYNTLDGRFKDAPALEQLFSREQRGIDFSLGMMGSPAVGSLLFRLKEYDKNAKGINHDEAYSTMRVRSHNERVVVVGSAVGGTGAAVAPTLARQCTKEQADVMAVMIQRWFKFRLEGQSKETYEKAILRNEVMEQNEASGLASFGQDLSKNAAAVLVGVPESRLVDRNYTSDNQQSIQDSYVHVIAALSALEHFLATEPFAPGLYGVSASDPTRLTGDIKVGQGTLQNLVDQASVFESVLEVFVRVLKSVSEKKGGYYSRLLCDVDELADKPETVAEHLDAFREQYFDSLKWLTSLGVSSVQREENESVRQFTLESKTAERLESSPLNAQEGQSSKAIACSLFHWTAKWISDHWRENGIELQGNPNTGALGAAGYWPTQKIPGLSPEWATAGDLASLPKEKVPGTLETLYDVKFVSHNGWPHPIAAAEHFRFQVQNSHELALRKLKLLLVGLASKEYELERVADRGGAGSYLNHLLKEVRNGDFTGLANYSIVRKNDGKILGFNSPWTLLCPVPSLQERDWQQVWHDLTGTIVGGDWEATQSWGTKELARGCVSRWFERLSDIIDSVPPLWANELQFTPSQPFALTARLPTYWGAHDDPDLIKYIPLPQLVDDRFHGWESQPFSELEPEYGESLLKSTPIGQWSFCKLRIHDREEPLRVVWQEHLELLQKEKHILAWQRGQAPDELVILLDLNRIVTLRNVRVISEAAIRIDACIPLAQKHVPGSTRTDNRVQFPDLPLRPEYLDLVMTKGDESLVDLLVQGVSDEDRFELWGRCTIGERRGYMDLEFTGTQEPGPDYDCSQFVTR